MGDRLIESITTIAVALVGVAIIAVLVSGQAKTSTVIQAAGSAFASDIGAAVSPVTGGGSYNGQGGANLPLNL